MARLAALFAFVLLSGCSDTGSDPGESTTPPIFIDDADRRGVVFTANSDLAGGIFLPEILLGGGAAIDFDDDGWMDLYLLQGSGGENVLLRNQGDGHFLPVEDPGDAAHGGYGFGVATADIDGDGDVDIYVSNLGPDLMLRNDGEGRFTDVTDEAGLGDAGWGTSVTFFDADMDGDADLFVVRYIDWSRESERDCTSSHGEPGYCHPGAYDAPTVDLYYENDGTGRFIDRTDVAGFGGVKGTGLGVAAADFDGDGFPDLFVANDDMPDRLWLNQGDGMFIESGFNMGCDRDLSGKTKAGMGVSVADVDDDGDPDLIVCNLAQETDSFYINEDGRFSDATNRSGIGAASLRFTRFGLGLRDFDNDSVMDYFAANGAVRYSRSAGTGDPYAEVNLMLRGRSTGLGFDEASDSGLDEMPARTSRGAIFADFDNDGGIDIVVLNRDAPAEFLANQVAPGSGHWLLIDVRDAAGAPALGATVAFDLGERTLTRFVRTDSSYLCAQDPRVHVGLGDATMVDRIEVRWPDGRSLVLKDVPVDSILRLDPPE